MRLRGFTVVELMVVIIVIGILASIVSIAYITIRDDGHDVAIKAVVRTAGDAIREHEMHTRSRITTQGYFSNSGSVDSLVSSGYLKNGYRSDLKSKNASNVNHILRWYTCGDGFIIYAALNNPTAEDISKFQSSRTACSHGETQAPTSGSIKYSYAQTF